MKWKHDKKEEPKLNIVPELYVPISTCCQCKIFTQVLQTYDGGWKLYVEHRGICPLHQEAALNKLKEKVRSKLV